MEFGKSYFVDVDQIIFIDITAKDKSTLLNFHLVGDRHFSKEFADVQAAQNEIEALTAYMESLDDEYCGDQCDCSGACCSEKSCCGDNCCSTQKCQCSRNRGCCDESAKACVCHMHLHGSFGHPPMGAFPHHPHMACCSPNPHMGFPMGMGRHCC